MHSYTVELLHFWVIILEFIVYIIDDSHVLQIYLQAGKLFPALLGMLTDQYDKVCVCVCVRVWGVVGVCA